MREPLRYAGLGAILLASLVAALVLDIQPWIVSVVFAVVVVAYLRIAFPSWTWGPHGVREDQANLSAVGWGLMVLCGIGIAVISPDLGSKIFGGGLALFALFYLLAQLRSRPPSRRI